MNYKYFFSAVAIITISCLLSVVESTAATRITKEMAKTIYIETCSVCHGEFGDGRTHAANALKPQPRDFKSPAAKAQLTELKILKTITEGNPGTAMVAWKYELKPSEIRAVVTYIRSDFMKITSYPAEGILSEDGEMPEVRIDDDRRTPLQTGTAAAPDLVLGKQTYEINCLACHGKNGDGKGPRYAFISPSPRKFTDSYEMEGINKNRIAESVKKGRPGSQMMAWAGILSPHEIDSVVEYIWQEFVAK